MNESYIALTYWDLAFAALLLVAGAGCSIALKLNIEYKILIAAARTAVQLTLIGLVLKTLFALTSPLWTGLAALVMVGFAGREIAARQEKRFMGMWTHGIGTGAMMVAAGVVTVMTLTINLGPDPWYHPRWALPILGMMLGNTMSGVSLGLDRLLSTVGRERVMIESRLALGHSANDALKPVVRDAIRAGMMPIVNAMSAAGVVSLPGMMTGQILSGVDPVEAVKYQILIMFLIAGAVTIGVILSVFGAVHRITDHRQRLRLDRLVSSN